MMVNTQVRIINEYGEDVARNGIEKGEIIIKGSGVIERTCPTQKVVDGWLYTGDIGTIDENGNIHMIEQKKM